MTVTLRMGFKALRARLVFAAILLSLFFASCATAPMTTLDLGDSPEPLNLEPGGFVYLIMDARSARAILQNIRFRGMDTSDRNFRLIIESAETAMLALYAENEATRFRLAAHGRFPSGRARFGLRTSRQWSGRRSPSSGETYWHSSDAQMSVAISRREALISTTLSDDSDTGQDPFFFGEGTEIPEGFGAFSQGAAIALWVVEPKDFITARFAEMRIPLEIPTEEFFAAVFPHSDANGEEGFVFSLRIKVQSEAQAAGLALALLFARVLFPAPDLNAIPEGAGLATTLMGILLANPIVAEESFLIATTEAMSAQEISALLGVLSF